MAVMNPTPSKAKMRRHPGLKTSPSAEMPAAPASLGCALEGLQAIYMGYFYKTERRNPELQRKSPLVSCLTPSA